MNHHAEPPAATAAALGLLSAGVTAAQIALMQLLACMQWHHFAHLVVAVALLGFGASGTVLTLWMRTLLAASRRLVPGLMAGCGAALIAAVILLQRDGLRFDLHLLFVESGQWLRLTLACLILAVPFFCGGLATGLILTAGADRAGRLYSASLAGAGVGAVAALALLELNEPAHLPGLIALAPIAGAGALWLSRRSRGGVACALALAITAGTSAWLAPPPVMSPFKDLARTLDLPGARIIASRPGAQGWLQLVEAPALRSAPPVSLNFTGRVPRQIAVFIDGNRRGSILAETDAMDVFDASVEALPWTVALPSRVLLLVNGAGGEAAFARHRGALEVVIVEPHRHLARVMDNQLRDDRSIRVVPGDPRRALVADGRYDLIRLPTAGAFGGSSGLRAVGEEPLYTREAIASAWRALTPGGAILVTAWMDHPERTPLRLLATLVAGLAEAGIDEPRAHLVAVRSWASATMLVRRAPITSHDAEAIRAFCGEHGFDPLVLPGLTTEDRTDHHAWDHADFFRTVDDILDGAGLHHVALARSFRLDGPTDERPYFSQFLRARGAVDLVRTAGWRGAPFFELGSIVVAISALILSALAIVLIALPLTRTGWQRGGRIWTLAYFAALGAGFMLLEIVLMQRLTLVAGGAIPAAALVLSALLIAAGLGSRWSQRVQPGPRTLAWITAGAAAGIAMLALVTRMLPVEWTAPWPVRMAACALLIAPVGWVMGMAFPTGLRWLADRAPAQLPWAWAINGCVSVATPSIATLLSVTGGYTAVFALAAVAYVVACTASLLASGRVAAGPPR